MADYVAYAAGTTPSEVYTHPGLRSELATLSNQMAELAYHHIADVRGVLTNLIQNAALDAWRSEDCVPILYAPSGVIYLARRGAIHLPERTTIAEDVVRRVKQVSSRQLRNNLTGFGRDGKGMKHADYYHLFFNRLDLLAVGFNATFKIIREGKTPSAGKRFDKLAAWMETGIESQTVDDVRVDQLAEWCYLAEKTAANLPGGGELTARVLLEALGLRELYEDFMEVPRDNRAGGVGYQWYFVAGHFFLKNRHLDPLQWRERVAELARGLVEHLRNAEATQPAPVSKTDGFDDLRQYVASVLSFGTTSLINEENTNHFVTELARYTNAKKARGRTPICSLCSSSYAVNKQQESAILFAPQVYSNKLQLHGNDAIRDICSICGTEIMLRQLLMNETNFKGKDFEARNLRYLYFYPSYFFTPETLAIFKIVHDQLRNISFTDLRRLLIDDTGERPELRFEAKVWQHLEPLLMTPEPLAPGQDRFLRMHFPEGEPITFYFLGIPPPSRDAKDAESWVNPAFLALLLPLCLDIKVVVSATSMPLLNEANELPETVFMDGAHAAIGYIVGEERINLDRVLPTLKRLATTYLIHLDGNSGMGSKGFDYRWQDLPTLARSLHESPLFVFHYLKKWQRKTESDSLPPAKVKLYLDFYQQLAKKENLHMSHARRLTELYWRFYRAKRKNGRLNSNSILRPLSEAAKALMTADRRLFPDREAMVELIQAQLNAFIDRVDTRRADGYIPKLEVVKNGKVRRVVDNAAVKEFADYWVNNLFFDTLRADLSALRGKQLNLLKNTCEVIYRDMDIRYWAQQNKPAPNDDDIDEDSAE